MTTEEIHTFNLDNEDMEMVEHFGDLDSVIESNGAGSQETKRGLGLGGQRRKVKKDREEQRCVVRDQG